MKIYPCKWVPMELTEPYEYGVSHWVLKNGMTMQKDDWLIYFNKKRYIVVPEVVARRYILESFIVRPRGDHWLVF